MNSIALKLIYDGTGPLIWSRKPGDFGLQDKLEALHVGAAGQNGVVVFNLTLQVKPAGREAIVLTGSFAHGPPAGRFLYLAWRNDQGGFAQRLKLPLAGITGSNVREARDRGVPLIGILSDHSPRLTSTGANIGGSRPMSWMLA